MRVFLIHGMGRSRASMMLLGSRLKRAGHDTSLFGYAVSVNPFDSICDDFITHIETVREGERGLLADDAESAGAVPYAIVGHSLGNIITRHAWDRLPPGVTSMVMLAPPNQSPKLARALKDNFVFRALTGEAGQQLADEAFYAALSVPDVPTLVLAGDGGPRFRFLPFDGERSDGVVAVSETGLAGAQRAILPVLHTFIMNDKRAARLVDHFIVHGELPDDGQRAA